MNPSLHPLASEQSIQAVGQQLLCQLAEHNVAVVTAPPGAGKSTILPLELLHGTSHAGKIVMLEPRRLAARQIAERMAHNLGEAVGESVGFRVRFESRVSAATRIEVLTEGILTRWLIDDPALEGVDVVLFDEFHERNLASDVALALTLEAQQTIRPDLRIVIMSATIDTTSICARLRAPLVEMQHRNHHVEIIRTGEEVKESATPQQIAAQVAQTVRQAHRQHQGDILAFLPGQAEITLCHQLLAPALPATHICPLYGLMEQALQHQAIAPSLPGERKVVLATPIAETSLTIAGVRIVVDSGLCRRLVFNPQSGLSTLSTVRISMDMATQRTGRAGRVADGVCYRLWSLATEHRMTPCRRPEIEEADLAPTCLDIAAWGGGQIQRLQWLTPPPTASVASANSLLCQLGALTPLGRITPHGRRLGVLPCHPRIAQMLAMAQGDDTKALAADVAALLEEKDPLASFESSTDITLRLIELRQMRRMGRLQRGWKQIARIAEQYRRIARVKECNSTPHATHAGLLLALAYPERIALAHTGGLGRFALASGGLAFVEKEDDISAHPWIAVGSLNAGTGRVFLAAPFEPSLLADASLIHTAEAESLVRSRAHIAWDNKRGQLLAQHERRIGTLLLEAHPLPNVDKQLATEAICQAAQKYGTSMLHFGPEVQNLQQRVAQVAQWHPQLQLPNLATHQVLQQPHSWLAPYLTDDAGRLRTATAELKRIDLAAALWSTLSWEQQQAVDQLAPTHIVVPTGSHIRVEYRQGAELPILRVRLQECFGMENTPRVDGGAVPVLMELLSPGFKPVQLTQDLHNFWQTTYFEVRKELKHRYPKHAWPDNPLQAQAVRGTKRPAER